MADGPLKLVRDAVPRRTSGRGATVLAATALACGLLATVLGADRARSAIDPRLEARRIADRALGEGFRAPAVLDSIRAVRADLGRSPLSVLRRVVYADLLLALARTPDDAPAAAFHAGLAAELAPVTVPVVWRSVVLLTRCGETEAALDHVSHMFSYDERAAAELLLEIVPLVGPDRAAGAVPPDPVAHVAWAAHLRTTGHRDRATAVLRDALARWPDSLAVVRASADRAFETGDVAALRGILGDLDLPVRRDTAVLHAYRCGVAASRGDRTVAQAAIDSARGSGWNDPEAERAIGDCLLALGDPAGARDTWRAALYRLEQPAAMLRASLWSRIADLDEREGRASDALRGWRRVLELDPDHARARTRIRALGGGRAGAS